MLLTFIWKFSKMESGQTLFQVLIEFTPNHKSNGI